MILDLLLDREPYATLAGRLLTDAEQGKLGGFICATAVTTVHYWIAKRLGKEGARLEVERLLRILDVAPVNRAVLEAALDPEFADYEDSVAHEAARQLGVDAIVTRNVKDYRRARLTVYTPAELAAALDQGAS